MAVAIVEMVEPALSQNFEGASEYFFLCVSTFLLHLSTFEILCASHQ